MNKKTIISVCIIIIIILVVIIDERVNKEEDDDYIVNGEDFVDYSWREKYGQYYNKNNYINFFRNSPSTVNWNKNLI